MHFDIIDMMADWKMYDWNTVTADEQVSKGPGFLVHAVISSNGSGVADAVLYDGYSTAGKVIIPLRCKDDDLESIGNPVPMYYKQGFDVNIGSNVAGVLLHWIDDMAHLKGHPDTQEHRGH